MKTYIYKNNLRKYFYFSIFVLNGCISECFAFYDAYKESLDDYRDEKQFYRSNDGKDYTPIIVLSLVIIGFIGTFLYEIIIGKQKTKDALKYGIMGGIFLPIIIQWIPLFLLGCVIYGICTIYKKIKKRLMETHKIQ